MNITIGNKIKDLRQSRKLTQEELGKALGVSFQAVSKWENNIALPDIALVPTIARYFGVSIDELLDYSKNDIDQAVDEICSRAYKFRESDPATSRAILEEGLEQYPDCCTNSFRRKMDILPRRGEIPILRTLQSLGTRLRCMKRRGNNSIRRKKGLCNSPIYGTRSFAALRQSCANQKMKIDFCNKTAANY